MNSDDQLETVNIRPGVSILSVLRHLNYRPWFAIAEFVDNSLQSAIDNKQALIEVDGDQYQLRVEVEVDGVDGRIVVRDNAAGIRHFEYRRAFRAAAVPPDQTGLSEFGMGMKSAACWLANKWQVRTSALGEDVERLISFDIGRIVRDSIEELTISERAAVAAAHFTTIVLSEPNQALRGRTIGKIKDHLASIYRVFIRDKSLLLTYNGDTLAFANPSILLAPNYRTPTAEPVAWKRSIDFDFGLGLTVKGFAAIREIASTSNAGFALFRRNRLIEGSLDDTYRPEEIFGKSNSYRYQRLFGELHLEGFAVSHTKDGFRWEEDEDEFLQLLRDELNRPDMPLLAQAEEHRVRSNVQDIRKAANQAIDRTADALEAGVAPVLDHQAAEVPTEHVPPTVLPKSEFCFTRQILLRFMDQDWQVSVEIVNDPAIGDWLTISSRQEDQNPNTVRCLSLRLAASHPFTVRFAGADATRLEPLLRLAVGIGLAEVTARASGATLSSLVRHNLNELLAGALSDP